VILGAFREFSSQATPASATMASSQTGPVHLGATYLGPARFQRHIRTMSIVQETPKRSWGWSAAV